MPKISTRDDEEGIENGHGRDHHADRTRRAMVQSRRTTPSSAKFHSRQKLNWWCWRRAVAAVGTPIELSRPRRTALHEAVAFRQLAQHLDGTAVDQPEVADVRGCAPARAN
jgi:hypothetical protein